MSSPKPRDRRPIRRLDAETVARIAAGEVVERPASIVKELVENAYDALATEVRVSIEGGGIDRITTTDDGVGIPASELPLAVERHATSKLADASELGRIGTLGFRGEALASIGAVSHLTLLSRTSSLEEAHGLRVEGGSIVGTFVRGAPTGTSVEVVRLFFNTPARRKFLRSAASEQLEVTGTLGSLYLARPTVTLVLEAQGTEVARYPRTGALQDAAVRVLGEELIGQELLLDGPEEDGIRIHAVLGRPSVTRGTSQGIHLSVNGRAIVSRPLVQSVRQGYEGYLPKGRFPVGVVQLELDPDRVDVNVHPTKREIRISKEREVGDRLRRLVRDGLASAPQAVDRETRTTVGRPLGPPLDRVRPRDRLSTHAHVGPVLSTSATASRSQLRLDEPGRPASVEGSGGHPRLRLLAPLFHLYWVAEADEALVLVDQHAASERVLFDTLRNEGKLARQELVTPVSLRLTPRQIAVLAAHEDQIRSSGYSVEPFGTGTYRVRSVPTFRGRRGAAEALPALLDELAEGGRPTVPNGLIERTNASLACHAAVRGGDTISADEMGRILEALYRLVEPSYACPHGRPILVRFSRGRLDRWFLRRGP